MKKKSIIKIIFILLAIFLLAFSIFGVLMRCSYYGTPWIPDEWQLGREETLTEKTFDKFCPRLFKLIDFYISIYQKEEVVIPPAIEPTPEAQKSKNPVIANSAGDFRGSNFGDFIHFSWSETDRTDKYVLFRSLSQDGPWIEIGDIPGSLGNGVDATPETRATTLCYRLEARDANGVVLRAYASICIPKYESEN